MKPKAIQRASLALALLIHPLILIVATAQEGQRQFLPTAGFIDELKKRSATTRCELVYNEAQGTWMLVLNRQTDQLEYSQSIDGIGSPTGSLLYTARGGGIDPTTSGGPLKEHNLVIAVHQKGQSYVRRDTSQVGTVSTMPKDSSFEDLIPFIGLGTEIRFHSESWVKFGDKMYRKGGFRLMDGALAFLPGTELLGDGGKISQISSGGGGTQSVPDPKRGKGKSKRGSN